MESVGCLSQELGLACPVPRGPPRPGSLEAPPVAFLLLLLEAAPLLLQLPDPTAQVQFLARLLLKKLLFILIEGQYSGYSHYPNHHVLVKNTECEEYPVIITSDFKTHDHLNSSLNTRVL